MKTALFTNISTKPFTGYWDGKPKTIKPGQSVYLPDYLANHFAKHLTNQLLLEKGDERSTSPKRPKDVPQFMDIFNQCYAEDEDEIDVTDNRDEVEVQMDVINRARAQKEPSEQLPSGAPTVLPMVPEDEDDEDAFGGKPSDDVLGGAPAEQAAQA